MGVLLFCFTSEGVDGARFAFPEYIALVTSPFGEVLWSPRLSVYQFVSVSHRDTFEGGVGARFAFPECFALVIYDLVEVYAPQ